MISHISVGGLCSARGSQKHSKSMDWSVPSGFSYRCHPDYFVSLAPTEFHACSEFLVGQPDLVDGQLCGSGSYREK